MSEVASTSSVLAGEARAGGCEPCVLVADHQTAGRGRLDRRWDDSPGGLMVSIRVPVAVKEAAAIGIRLAAAARSALQDSLPHPVLVKWPNDLVIEAGPAPGKLAGILSELVDGAEPVVVAGLGCNLEPVPTQPGATSMRQCGAGEELDRDPLLSEVLRAFAGPFADQSVALAEVRTRSATLGRLVRVTLPGGRVIEGVATAIDDRGRLVVAGPGGAESVTAGDVVSVRRG
ncbi:MAG: biotin--[acetyl-CoA-carboxylase] ligase [Acidimicrobiales bacterium]